MGPSDVNVGLKKNGNVGSLKNSINHSEIGVTVFAPT